MITRRPVSRTLKDIVKDPAELVATGVTASTYKQLGLTASRSESRTAILRLCLYVAHIEARLLFSYPLLYRIDMYLVDMLQRLIEITRASAAKWFLS